VILFWDDFGEFWKCRSIGGMCELAELKSMKFS
jgi:hypothetical protein